MDSIPRGQMQNSDWDAVWCELPEHVVERILAWLPLECLFRFRSVGKQWNQLFSCPNFINLWTNIPNRQPWLVLCMPKTQMRCLAYCFFTHTWKTVSISFLPDKCGVNYKGSAAGLLLVDVPACSSFGHAFSRLCVCNPLSRKCMRLPGMHSITTVMARGIVSGENRETYKVVVVGESRKNSIVVEVYDSQPKSWKIAGQLPNGLMIRNEEMVFCGGFFFCMTVQPLGVMAYSLREGALTVLPLPLWKSSNIWPRLVSCGSSVLIAGAIEEGHVLKDIIIWEFQKNPKDCWWREIGRMPQAVREEFQRSSCSNWFECVGVGESMCFRAHGSMDVLVFLLTHRSWSWIPKCPTRHGDRKYLLLRSMAFEPRPDMRV